MAPQPCKVHRMLPDHHAPNLFSNYLLVFSCCWISMPTSTSKTTKMTATPPCTWQSCTRTSTLSNCCWTGGGQCWLLKFDAVSWSPSFARPDFTIDRKRVRPAGCRGADVSIRNNDNATAAMVAADHGDEELADLLSQRQALKRLQSTNTSRPHRLDSCLSSRNSQRPVEEGKL